MRSVSNGPDQDNEQMALYLIGDVQGCDAALAQLLQKIDFSPSRDTLYLLGDLVNRGPASLAVLQRLHALGDAAQCLLGNHDLHLLAVSQGVRKPHRKDTLNGVLQSPRCAELIEWLRHRPMALQARGWLMVHAGVLPAWTLSQTLALAAEVQTVLRSPGWGEALQHLYGNQPDRWHDGLQGADRCRVVINALTRLRLCTADGVMEFKSKDSAEQAPAGYLPWYSVPGRRTRGVPIAFGHWSTLGKAQDRSVLPLDTGCVWGGCLTAARLSDQPGKVAERIEVRCAPLQTLG